jgi:hypothetical protein
MGHAIHPKPQELAQPTLLVSMSLGSLGCVETMSPNHKRHSFGLKHISLLSRSFLILFCIPQDFYFRHFPSLLTTVRFYPLQRTSLRSLTTLVHRQTRTLALHDSSLFFFEFNCDFKVWLIAGWNFEKTKTAFPGSNQTNYRVLVCQYIIVSQS